MYHNPLTSDNVFLAYSGFLWAILFSALLRLTNLYDNSVEIPKITFSVRIYLSD